MQAGKGQRHLREPVAQAFSRLSYHSEEPGGAGYIPASSSLAAGGRASRPRCLPGSTGQERGGQADSPRHGRSHTSRKNLTAMTTSVASRIVAPLLMRPLAAVLTQETPEDALLAF